MHVTPDFRVVQRSKGKRVGAEEATSKVKINSSFYADSTALSKEETAAIKQPSSERYVTESVDDGEVPLLIDALGQFFDYLAKAALKTVSRLQVHNFTLDFAGSWGPCTGCRERIRKFIDLWKEKCAEVLRQGEQANLTITFTYDNAPQKFTREGWFTVYGWWEDGGGKGPFKHTITKTVRG
jgi:hypothetical protein